MRLDNTGLHKTIQASDVSIILLCVYLFSILMIISFLSICYLSHIIKDVLRGIHVKTSSLSRRCISDHPSLPYQSPLHLSPLRATFSISNPSTLHGSHCT